MGLIMFSTIESLDHKGVPVFLGLGETYKLTPYKMRSPLEPLKPRAEREQILISSHTFSSEEAFKKNRSRLTLSCARVQKQSLVSSKPKYKLHSSYSGELLVGSEESIPPPEIKMALDSEESKYAEELPKSKVQSRLQIGSSEYFLQDSYEDLVAQIKSQQGNYPGTQNKAKVSRKKL